MEELKGNKPTTFFDRTKNHSTLSGAFECNYFEGGGGGWGVKQANLQKYKCQGSRSGKGNV